MPNDTNLNKKKKAPVICAVLMIGLLGILLGIMIFSMLNEANGELAAIGVIIIYGLLVLATIIGIVIALRQRLREIEGGEEDEARKY